MSNETTPSPFFLRAGLIDKLISLDHNERAHVYHDLGQISEIVRVLDAAISNKTTTLPIPSLLAKFRLFVDAVQIRHPTKGVIPVEYLPWYDHEFTRLTGALFTPTSAAGKEAPNLAETIYRPRQIGTSTFLLLYTSFMNKNGTRVALISPFMSDTSRGIVDAEAVLVQAMIYKHENLLPGTNLVSQVIMDNCDSDKLCGVRTPGVLFRYFTVE
jgi:hypothetical protein